MPKEQILAEVNVPQLPQRRVGVVEKAAAILQPSNVPSPAPQTHLSTPTLSGVKVTFRLLPDQVTWLKQKIQSYHAAHPRAVRLTTQEVIRMLVDHAKTLDLDKLIARYRAQNSE
jgi:hypothetical protein